MEQQIAGGCGTATGAAVVLHEQEARASPRLPARWLPCPDLADSQTTPPWSRFQSDWFTLALQSPVAGLVTRLRRGRSGEARPTTARDATSLARAVTRHSITRGLHTLMRNMEDADSKSSRPHGAAASADSRDRIVGLGRVRSHRHTPAMEGAPDPTGKTW